MAEGNLSKYGGESRETERFVFFFRSENVFSQFNWANFEDEAGKKFVCAEQYMHYHKAVLFKDENIAAQILKTDDPKCHKDLGRKVANFDQEMWTQQSAEIVKKGNLLKFQQNSQPRELLFSTYPKILVEASPTDKIWGIGLPVSSDKVTDQAKWKGENRLGKILTEVRDQLMREEGLINDEGNLKT